jgi:hypothetical protein
MRHHPAAALLLALCACRSTDAPALTSSGLPPAHPSALGGAVAVLEELARATPPGALVALRALESDALASTAEGERGSRPEAVRVFLHLTVYSMTPEGAREGYDALARRVEERLLAAGPAEPLTRARVEALVGELDWDPSGREDLYSFSNALRLIVPAPSAARMAPAPRGDGVPSASLASFVLDEARAAGLGELALTSEVPSGSEELRCTITSDAREASHRRVEIGAFLAALEERSPATRVTRLTLERSQEAPDPHAERSWTFRAELGVVLEP